VLFEMIRDLLLLSGNASLVAHGWTNSDWL